MSPSTLIWNSPLPAEWPVRADSLKVKNYTKNTQQIIFFISRKINTNILGPNFFEPKLSPAQKNLNQVYPAACASSELLRACFISLLLFFFFFSFIFVCVCIFVCLCVYLCLCRYLYLQWKREAGAGGSTVSLEKWPL